MQRIHISAKEIPLVDSYDVIVAGGGTAGAAAGIASAREGLKTLIIEQFGSLGGSQTNALVQPMMSAYIAGRSGHCPISAEINERCMKYGGTATHGINGAVFFDNVTLKMVLEEMASESKCDIMYHTAVTEVNKNAADEIEYIVAHNKNGLTAYKAKRYIDCTGDADLAYMAGAEFECGDENGLNQAVSLRFEMTNVDTGKLSDYLEANGQTDQLRYPVIHSDNFGYCPGLRKLILDKAAEGYLTKQDLAHIQFFSVPGKPANMSFNCPELGTSENVIDADYLTQKQIEGRQAILRISKFMQLFVPGFEQAYVSEIAPMVGIRESRRIKAMYTLTIDDIFNYRKFDDGISESNYPIDVHGVSGNEKQKKYITDISEEQKYWEIPMRCLIPKGISNLLVAGRCAGFSFMAQSAARVQHSCRAMGQAAGIACKISISEGLSFANIDHAMIKKILRGDVK